MTTKYVVDRVNNPPLEVFLYLDSTGKTTNRVAIEKDSSAYSLLLFTAEEAEELGTVLLYFAKELLHGK